jgi:hypothetical protein
MIDDLSIANDEYHRARDLLLLHIFVHHHVDALKSGRREACVFGLCSRR